MTRLLSISLVNTLILIITVSPLVSTLIDPQAFEKTKKANGTGNSKNVSGVVVHKEDIEELPTLNLSVNVTKEINTNQTQTFNKSLGTNNGTLKDSIEENKPREPNSKQENISNKPFKPQQDIESGAVKRGVLVFVAISMLFMIYVGIKTYRNRRKPNVVVRKYGVRTKRSDLEMRPLPLDDDEDDETVFDLHNVNRI